MKLNGYNQRATQHTSNTKYISIVGLIGVGKIMQSLIGTFSFLEIYKYMLLFFYIIGFDFIIISAKQSLQSGRQ